MTSNVLNTKGRVCLYFQTTRKELKTRRVEARVFLTNFEVFDDEVKHYLECLIYVLN